MAGACQRPAISALTALGFESGLDNNIAAKVIFFTGASSGLAEAGAPSFRSGQALCREHADVNACAPALCTKNLFSVPGANKTKKQATEHVGDPTIPVLSGRVAYCGIVVQRSGRPAASAALPTKEPDDLIRIESTLLRRIPSPDQWQETAGPGTRSCRGSSFQAARSGPTGPARTPCGGFPSKEPVKPLATA